MLREGDGHDRFPPIFFRPRESNLDAAKLH